MGSSADSTSSQGNVSRMSIDREFLVMEIDEVKDHRLYFEEEESNVYGGQADDDALKRFKTGPENLLIEFVLIGAVALICIILFIIYIRMAKNEVIPKEYFMKNRIPLIKKVLKNKMDIKKAMKAMKEKKEKDDE